GPRPLCGVNSRADGPRSRASRGCRRSATGRARTLAPGRSVATSRRSSWGPPVRSACSSRPTTRPSCPAGGRITSTRDGSSRAERSATAETSSHGSGARSRRWTPPHSGAARSTGTGSPRSHSSRATGARRGTTPRGPFAARPYLPSASRCPHTPGRRHGASAKAGGGAGRTLYLERAGGSVEAVVIAVVVVAVVLFFVSTYNRLVTLRQRVKEAWADIDVQLKRRHDLIPNLVETVKGYATHESTVFQKVTEARAAAVAAGASATPEQRAQAENMLTSALRSVFAVA